MENKNLSIGKKCSSGQVISEILGQSARATIYTTKDGHLRWEFHENNGVVPEELLPAVNEFDSLMLEIKELVTKQRQKEAFVRLGKSLFAALNSTNNDDKLVYYKSIKSFIYRVAQQNVRIIYVSFCIGVTALVVGLAFVSNWLLVVEGIDVFIYAGMFGGIGACISVMQRANNIEIDLTLSKKGLCLQGVVRILLGVLFGIFFTMACKGNLVLGTFKEQTIVLYVFAVISGVSERFIPQLIEQLEAKGISAGSE
jgi:hypothetical protein